MTVALLITFVGRTMRYTTRMTRGAATAWLESGGIQGSIDTATGTTTVWAGQSDADVALAVARATMRYLDGLRKRGEPLNVRTTNALFVSVDSHEFATVEVVIDQQVQAADDEEAVSESAAPDPADPDAVWDWATRQT